MSKMLRRYISHAHMIVEIVLKKTNKPIFCLIEYINHKNVMFFPSLLFLANPLPNCLKEFASHSLSVFSSLLLFSLLLFFWLVYPVFSLSLFLPIIMCNEVSRMNNSTSFDTPSYCSITTNTHTVSQLK